MKTGFKKLFTCLCLVAILGTPMVSFAQVSDAERAQLEKELAQLQDEIAQKQKELDAQKKNSASLTNDVSLLTSQINKAKLEIVAKNKVLQQIGGQINQKDKTIQTLDTKRNRQEESLSQILRKKYQMDNSTLAEILLSKQTLSGFLGEVDNLQAINEGIQTSFGIIKKTKELTAAEKEALEQKKNQENDVKYQLENQKKNVETTQAEKNRMLSISKGQEKNYEAVIKDRQARVTKIRSELIKFEGSGIQGRSISFGEAYDFAKNASKKTGVRTAFILAIMQQETNFGSNFGGCYLKNSETGEGVYIKTGKPSQRNMYPGNFDSFVKITTQLGMNWKTTPISCALVRADGSIYGYGGAMGYTQFIPNTWMLVEARVRAYTKSSVGNPWNPQHAVMATAIFLQDRGASIGTYTAEHEAACRYYGACSSYANSVMSKAANIQKTIDQLEQLSN